MRRIRVDPRADADLIRAGAWYDTQRPGLGDRFLDEVERALIVASAVRFAYTPFRRHTRRINLRHFPYAIYYVIEGELLRVVAVLHQRRGTSAWRGRVREAAQVA